MPAFAHAFRIGLLLIAASAALSACGGNGGSGLGGIGGASGTPAGDPPATGAKAPELRCAP